MVGQLGRAKLQARAFVGLQQVDERRAAVARITVDMLEQVQGGLAAAVEGFDVARLGVHRVLGGELVAQRLQFAQTFRLERMLHGQCVGQLGQHGAQVRVGVADQPAQRAQCQAQGSGGLVEHAGAPQTMALMGMVRGFLPPKMLTSLEPSEQPLPNEKPQPPRTSKAFSAYSRCVVGMTKRSS